MADLLVHSYVRSVRISRLSNEVRSLGRMSQEVFSDRQHFTDSLDAVDQPLLACPIFHCRIIFPVNVDAIELIVFNEVSKLGACLLRIEALSGWELSGSECRDHDLGIVAMVVLSEIGLDLCLSLAEWTVSCSEVKQRV